MLMTKHMLFVGFSFTDYNFHRIISAVRSARSDNPQVNSAHCFFP
jgi:hypothetical protein